MPPCPNSPFLGTSFPRTPERYSKGKLIAWQQAELWDSVLLYSDKRRLPDYETLLSAHPSLLGLKYYHEGISLPMRHSVH